MSLLSALDAYIATLIHRMIHPSIHSTDSTMSLFSSAPVSAAVVLTAADAADALIDARVVASTKRNYNGRLRLIKHYYQTELQHPDLILPVRLTEIQGFFGWLIDIKGKDKPPAFSTVRAYKSALVWYYKEHKQIIDPLIDQGLETLLKGYRRRVADLKLEGKIAIFEGKQHLTYDGYCLIAAALFKAEPFSAMLFGWPFLVLQWNLIARSATIGGMMMEHIGWEGDSLLISTPKHKADQEGVKCFARHVYANPSNPAICPILALAVLVFTRAVKHDSTQPAASTAPPNFRIFDGSHSEARFSEVLGRIITSLSESDQSRLGAEKKQLGTHSVRKGSASYCAGMMNGPSTVQVFLRAGWSLGNVQDRYLFAGAGGDQLTGRVLSGLPFNDASFASLPPHFTAEGLAKIRWTTVLPLYTRIPETFKRALPYLLASICFHEQWLRSTLPAHHPLFHTHLFASGDVQMLRMFVVAGRNRCPLTSVIATGIPPHLVLSNELTDVARQTELLKETLLTKCTELPAELVSVMLSKFSINGAIPVTIDDIKMLLNNAVNQMRAELREAIPAATTATTALHSLTDSNADPRFQLWMWKGAMHMVPEGWLFPSTDVKATWNLWHHGHVQDKIRPLRHLKKADLQGASQITLWSKTNGVMTAVAEMMVEMKAVEAAADVTRLSAEEWSSKFDAAIVQLMEKVKEGSTRTRSRWMEMSIGTLYNHLKPARLQRKRKREESQAAGCDVEISEAE